MDLTIDADRASFLVDHRKHDPVVEDDELFDFEAKLGERAEPFVQERTNCRSAFEIFRSAVKERIGSEEAHYRVDVTLIHSLEGKARKLSRIGGRGLLRHGEEYPADGGQHYAASGTACARARAHDSLARIVRSACSRTRSMRQTPMTTHPRSPAITGVASFARPS